MSSLAQEACVSGQARGVMPFSYASFAAAFLPGLLGMRRAPVGGHTDADTLGHTPHERTRRLLVIPPSVLAHAEETGPAPGSTVPHGQRWAPGAISYASGSMVVPDG